MNIFRYRGRNLQNLFFSVLAAMFLSQAWAGTARSQDNRASTPFSPDYFCMHVHSKPGYEQAFTDAPFRFLRTWDSGIVWPRIEPEKGEWNWELLDDYVRLAREKGATLIFTLAMTPPWAAKNPDAPSPYGSCCSSSPPADIEDWKTFVRTLAERNETEYGGTIRYWEVWNEPDNLVHGGYNFYTGTLEELVELGRVASEILKSVSPDNMIIGPGITQAGAKWLGLFLEQGGSDYTDIVAYHFYWDWHSPSISDFRTAMGGVRDVMEENGLADKPLWITETGFGMKHYKTPEEREMALALTVIMPRYFGADMSCAYAWNNDLFTTMYDNKKQETTHLAKAYSVLHQWLNGAAIVDISAGTGRTRICSLEKNGVQAKIIWRDRPGDISFQVPDGTGSLLYRLDGSSAPMPDTGIIEMGSRPVLIADEAFLQL